MLLLWFFSSYYKMRIIPKNENRHAFTLFPPLPISAYTFIFSMPCVLFSLNCSVQSFDFWFSNMLVFLGLICPMLFCRHFCLFSFFSLVWFSHLELFCKGPLLSSFLMFMEICVIALYVWLLGPLPIPSLPLLASSLPQSVCFYSWLKYSYRS